MHHSPIFASRYYEAGVSSVYLWDLDHGFAGVILIKKGELSALCMFFVYVHILHILCALCFTSERLQV